MYTSSIYKKSPIFIQNVMVSLRDLVRAAIRSEKRVAGLKSQLRENEYSHDALKAFCDKQLEAALLRAKGTAAYGAHQQLEQFAFIDKQDVKASPDAFLNTQIKPKVTVKGSTSGTTGTPLSIPQDLNSVLREQAFVSRHLEWAGYQKGDKRAWIRGDVVVPLSQKVGPYWRYSIFENMILMSSFHLTADAIPDYLTAMEEYGVDIIQAYPSSIATLAKFLESKDWYYRGKLKSIVTSSESLSQEDREVIEKRFQCKVFDWYGLFERVAAIGSCEHGNYHLISDYSHVEFLDCGDGKHEIVGSNYNNALYPLIRYRTGDHVVLSSEQCCPCGRTYPVIEKIEGRVGDFLLGEDGQKIHILNHIPKGIEGLISCQFVQEKAESIKVLAVVDEAKFTTQQEQQLITNTNERVGQSMQVDVIRVDALPRTKNGKVRQAVCSVENKF
ncbi:phenylacetate--CoA ligase family protein [Vibrio neptunius]|uniref:Phenylacetate--CoA ligase family protein n=1 Tax=Vibrio neptunius TaxID=170651 RepID=A0ABS3A281_9VIBR|nr:phenylacetate--CoA ligase family protein [Vibrio neptunius]MBN3516372.1 phenylacetate--CoA ligase family protein [Vibrio neptunius]MBN3550475.1 phenylacetate--CoA ligase family protein [Vibrio neptunius]MBN3578606.1 phenylacetate--CoA ligase family protein [Vibrio neptunius]MCH9872271.1 phenylacetate--CoA ligase family protein [Vibrio neptunius]